MAPSKTELWTQLRRAIDLLDTNYKYFSGDGATTPNLLANIILLQNEFEGNHIGSTQAQLDALRSQAGSMVTIGVGLLSPVLQELGKIGYSSINTNILSILDDIYNGMVLASETVRYRHFTFGSIAIGGANIGSGTVYRLTKDKNDYDIEEGAANAGITKIECLSDRYSGSATGRESFKIFGYGIILQDVIEQGTAPVASLNILAYRANDGKLTNPTFDTYGGVGAAFTATGWNFATPANFQADVANYYRKTIGSDTGVALEFLDNSYVYQDLVSDTGSASITVDKTKPVFLILRYYRKASCDGSLTLTLGSKTINVADLTAVADATWIDLTIGVAANNDGWYEEWFSNGAQVKVQLASNTTGTLLIDEIILAQPTKYDGKYYLITAGITDFLLDDYFTFTDTVLNTGRIQYTINKLFNKYFPHLTAGETYADF